jgi:hypothetical protein
VLLLAVGLMGHAGAFRDSAGLRWMALVVAGVLALGVGLFWGYLAQHVDASVKRMLLLMFVPGFLLVGRLLGEPGGAAFRLSPKRVAWVWTVGSFYLGYGIGWLALWGYLGG